MGGRYGYRRIRALLRIQGWQVGLGRVVAAPGYAKELDDGWREKKREADRNGAFRHPFGHRQLE